METDENHTTCGYLHLLPMVIYATCGTSDTGDRNTHYNIDNIMSYSNDIVTVFGCEI